MIREYVRQLRPRQWTKNLILFAGVIFAGRLLEPELLLRSVLGFLTFCLVSSSIYCINDLMDIESDRMHPEKRLRPLPSGKLPVSGVWTLGLTLFVVATVAAWLLSPKFCAVVFVYFASNLAYSLRLKRMAILDVIVLATGFVLRAVGSVEVLDRPEVIISPWLLLCTFFLAMFIGAGKRRAELALLETEAASHRASLTGYSLRFLDRVMSSTMTSAILTYSIYTLHPETKLKFGTYRLVYTVPFVVFGLFRYMYLIYERAKGGNPTEAILHDRGLLAAVFFWVLIVVYVLYVHG
jgi:4-hydroxybenzoate polyprenyltransferase